MKLKHSLVAIVLIVFATQLSQAQDSIRKKRLRNAVAVRGFVGGEAQDHYVIRARKGQRMTVRITWRKEDDNSASFSVSPDSENAEPLAGQESDGGKRWVGRIPKTGDYLISVVAHPSARYTLVVTVR